MAVTEKQQKWAKMKNKILSIFLCSLAFLSAIGTALSLDNFQTFVAANLHTSKRGDWVQLLARGAGTNDFYVLEVDPTTGAIAVSSGPTASGGLSMNTLTSAATTNATVVKASAGQLYDIYLSNINAAPAYVKFYNKATTPTCNSDTIVQKFIIPGNATGAGAIVSSAMGKAFSSGISYCITTGAANNDNTAVAASEVIVNIGYK